MAFKTTTPRPSRRLAALLAVVLAAAWAVGIVEGLLLYLTGSGRAADDWIHAFLVYGWFGIVVAVVVAGLTWPLERRWPSIIEAAALPCALCASTVVVGGMWLNRWSGMPRFGSPAGLAINAALVFSMLGVALVWVRWRWWNRQDPTASRRPVILGIFLLSGLLVGTAARLAPALSRPGDAPPATGPPVVVLMIDTLRRDHLGCYGYAADTSPNIDALARDAVVFDASTTSGNLTFASIASLFTGLYPSQHGVVEFSRRLPADRHMLARWFRDSGYRTGAFVANPVIRPATGFDRGFDCFDPQPPPSWLRSRSTAFDLAAWRLWKPTGDGLASRLVPRALGWLQESTERPPFLYLHLIEPHSPYDPPADCARLFLQDSDELGPMDPPNIWKYRSPGSWNTFEDVAPGPQVDAPTRRRMLGLYDGEIRHVDAWIGRFLDSLRERGLYDDALVVLLSDHGEEFGDHGGWFHGLTLFEEMVAMPLIVKLPRQRFAGTRSELDLDMVDLGATLSGLAGLGSPWPNGGRNHAPAILDGSFLEARSSSSTAFVERPPHLFGMRSGRWKLIRRVRGEASDDRLFDLSVDPAELVELGGEHPDTLLVLQLRLDALVDSLGSGAAESVPATDPATLRALRALGYTH